MLLHVFYALPCSEGGGNSRCKLLVWYIYIYIYDYIYSDGQSLRTYFGKKKSEYYCFFYVLSVALRTSKTIHLERPNIKIHHLERTGDLTLRTCLGQ